MKIISRSQAIKMARMIADCNGCSINPNELTYDKLTVHPDILGGGVEVVIYDIDGVDGSNEYTFKIDPNGYITLEEVGEKQWIC